MKRKGQDIRTFFKKRSVNQRETEEVETQKDSQSVEEETQKVSQSVEVETQKDSQSVEVESQKDSPEPPEDTTSPTGPHDISKHRGDSPSQPIRQGFPRTLQGGAWRSFHVEWYQERQWLEYSHSKDAAYCYPCRHFSLPNVPKSVFTSVDGYCNWKKATFRDSGFCRHAKSEHHVNAMLAWEEDKRRKDNNTSMIVLMEAENRKKITDNQKYIKTLGEILCLTATQNIAQRGHRESSDSENRGNFLEILELVSKHDQSVRTRLEDQAKNAKYTSSHIQNEMISILAGMVRDEIIKEVKESEQFSVIVDETKDIKKKEQMSFVLRYFYNGMVHESFLEFQEAERLDAAGLTEKIIDCLERHGLNYKENLVGQGYDGAAVMSGKHSGVQARIRDVASHAFYVHCSAHCLNLVIVDSVKSVSEAGKFFSLLERLYVFMSGSYAHEKWLKVQQEMFKGEGPRELQRLSDTRWACRYVACRNVMDRLPAIVCVLEDISHEDNPDRAVEARGILHQIDLNFIGCLVVFRKILGESKFLSDMLQSTKIDLTKAVELAETLQQTLREYRSEPSFETVWGEVLDICQSNSIPTSQPTCKRARQVARTLQSSVVTSTLGQHTEPDNKESFRVKVYYSIIDCMIGEMERRFSKINCEIMKGIQAFNPSSPSFLSEEAVLLLANSYGTNSDDVKLELHQVKRLFDRTAKKERPTSLMELLLFLDPIKTVFFELHRLCKIAVVLPVSSASCERSFSTLKLVKNHLRSTMAENRLSSLATLSIESARAKGLDLDEFVRRFAVEHGNRRIVLF
ncbi:zinc finger MYM-type protein 1 isoform X2 [Pleuronectes platessa]|nr:zinc finger MYM-type protein 1 isoform X2 [Pleuronectes platessa]